jgi:ribosome-binding factor A
MNRPEKVAHQLKRDISEIFMKEINDPRLGFVTVTQVEMSRDLRVAKIFYSVLGSAKEEKESKSALESAKGFVRSIIGQRLKMRLTPELIFISDRSAEYSVQIQQALERLKREEQSRD